jgi:hypothetical protein
VVPTLRSPVPRRVLEATSCEAESEEMGSPETPSAGSSVSLKGRQGEQQANAASSALGGAAGAGASAAAGASAGGNF